MSITFKTGAAQLFDAKGELLGNIKSASLVVSPENGRLISTLHDTQQTLLNRLTVKHYRLSLMMGDEYAEQMIIALHALATKGRESYEELLDEALFASFHAYNGYSFRALGLRRKR